MRGFWGSLTIAAASPKNVTPLRKTLGLKQPTVSYHLGLLRMGRLVEGIRKGKSVVYVTDVATGEKIVASAKSLSIAP